MTEQAPEAPSRYEIGMRRRREVLGDAYVDRALAATGALDQEFQRLITEAAWGTVWANEDITLRERLMLTLAIVAALGNFDDIARYIHMAPKAGLSERDVAQTFQHVALYAGLPRANQALKAAKKAYGEHEAAMRRPSGSLRSSAPLPPGDGP